MSSTLHSTTLVAFLLQAPTATMKVDLFGSWDNFSKAYPMQRDGRISHWHWRGCHTFTDIICDGHAPEIGSRRDGGLQMGGIYWYYYQLNGYIDYFNPAEASTTACPYLPGQEVNILEVPVQIRQSSGPGRRRSTSSTMSAMFTLNPDDKYVTPKPPPRTAYLRRASLTPSVSERFEKAKIDLESPRDFHKNIIHKKSHERIRPVRSDPVIFTQLEKPNELAYYSEPVSTRSSLQTALAQCRRLKSAQGDVNLAQDNDVAEDVSNVVTPANLDIPSKDPSLQSDPSYLTGNIPAFTIEHITKYQLRLSTASKRPPMTAVAITDPPHNPAKSFWKLPSMQSIRREAGEKWTNLSTPKATVSGGADQLYAQLDKLQLEPSPSDGINRIQPNLSSSAEDLATRYSMSADCNHYENEQEDGKTRNPNDTITRSILTPLDIAINRTDQTPQLIMNSTSSQAPSHFFSPTLSFSTTTDLISSSQPSQPDTPIMSEFGDDWLGPSQSTSMFQSTVRSFGVQQDLMVRAIQEPGGFGGYGLSEVEQTSTLTLQNLPTTPMHQRDSGSAHNSKSRSYLVESWNDGSKHRNPPVDDIFEDLTYLGGIIH